MPDKIVLESGTTLEYVPPTTTRSLHRKLAQVMYEVERIPKRGRAPAAMGGFEFVQVGDAADVIRKALAETGVTMIPTAIELISETESETASKKLMTTVTVRTTWTVTDGDSGESVVIQSMGSGADMGDKAIPKAQSNAMKYALLMGFLLSTGDDPELSDSSDRQRRESPDRTLHLDKPKAEADPESTYSAGDWSVVGKAEAGSNSPVDAELRETPDGGVFGFVIETAEKKRFQIVAEGPMALPVAMVWDALNGAEVRAKGQIELVPWSKEVKGQTRSMPPYRRIHAERIESADVIIPAPAVADGPVPVDGQAQVGALSAAEDAELDMALGLVP